MLLYDKKLFSNTHVFERIFFFFARQFRTLIKQIIFQKHCFNHTSLHNNLILYQEARKFNMDVVKNLTKQSTVFHPIFL